MEMNRVENMLFIEVSGKSYVVEVHSRGVTASVLVDGKELAKQEVTALGDELLERTFEVALELILNNSFGQSEQVDELLFNLETDLQKELHELVLEGQRIKTLNK